MLSVVWFQPSYAAPVAAAFFILVVQGMRHLRHIWFRGRPVGVFLTRMVVIAAWAWAMVQTVHAARYPISKWSDRRARVAATLADKPGQHLVLVRYLPSHNPHKEWVYNAADIDHAKIVWAREIPGRDLRPLLDYYRDRSVWVVEADLPSPSFAPYRAPNPTLADALFERLGLVQARHHDRQFDLGALDSKCLIGWRIGLKGGIHQGSLGAGTTKPRSAPAGFLLQLSGSADQSILSLPEFTKDLYRRLRCHPCSGPSL
jgi:hypothetical protein